MGMRRGWHQIVTRVGENTAKDYSDRAERETVLGENDIFLVDIGPIFEDCEGDAGDTFVVGDNPLHHNIKSDVREIWHEVRDRWLETRESGRELIEPAGRFGAYYEDLLLEAQSFPTGRFRRPYPSPSRSAPSRRQVSASLAGEADLAKFMLATPRDPGGTGPVASPTHMPYGPIV